MKYDDHQKELEKQESMATIPAMVRNAVFKRAADASAAVLARTHKDLRTGGERTDYLHATTTEYRELARLVKRAFKAGEKSVGVERAQARIRIKERGWEVQFNGDRWLRPHDLPVGSEARLVWDASTRKPPTDSPATRSDQGVLIVVSLHVEVQP